MTSISNITLSNPNILLIFLMFSPTTINYWKLGVGIYCIVCCEKFLLTTNWSYVHKNIGENVFLLCKFENMNKKISYCVQFSDRNQTPLSKWCPKEDYSKWACFSKIVFVFVVLRMLRLITVIRLPKKVTKNPFFLIIIFIVITMAIQNFAMKHPCPPFCHHPLLSLPHNFLLVCQLNPND